MILEKTPDQLAREDLIRQTLEEAANAIEMKAGNATYLRAWSIAARLVRGLVPVLTKNNET